MAKKYDRMSNPYTTIVTPKEYAEWRSQLAKTANTRLRALERKTSSVTGSSYTFGAYKHYAADVLHMDKPRWTESKKPSNLNTMRREITQLQAFLNAQTSTIRGVEKVERARIRTFSSGSWGRSKNKRHLATADTAEFYDFLNSGILSDKVNPYFSSERIIELYDEARESKSHAEVMEIFETALEDYKSRRAPHSVEDIKERLGLKWS